MTRKCDYWNLIVLWNIVMQVQYLNIHSCLHTPLQSNLESLPCLHIYKSIIFSLFQLLDCSHAGASLWIMLRRTNRSRYFFKVWYSFYCSLATAKLYGRKYTNTGCQAMLREKRRHKHMHIHKYTHTQTHARMHVYTRTIGFFQLLPVKSTHRVFDRSEVTKDIRHAVGLNLEQSLCSQSLIISCTYTLDLS